MSNLPSILQAAKAISFEERTELVESLVAMECPEDAEWDPELLAEIDRRSMEYHDGKVQLKSWDEVKANAWQRLQGNATR